MQLRESTGGLVRNDYKVADFTGGSVGTLDDFTDEQINYLEKVHLKNQKTFSMKSSTQEFKLDFGGKLANMANMTLQKVKFNRFARVSCLLCFWVPLMDTRKPMKVRACLIDNRQGEKSIINGIDFVASEQTMFIMNMPHYVAIDDLLGLSFVVKVDGVSAGEFRSGHLFCRWTFEYVGKPTLYERVVLPPVKVPRVTNDINKDFIEMQKKWKADKNTESRKHTGRLDNVMGTGNDYQRNQLNVFKDTFSDGSKSGTITNSGERSGHFDEEENQPRFPDGSNVPQSSPFDVNAHNRNIETQRYHNQHSGTNDTHNYNSTYVPVMH